MEKNYLVENLSSEELSYLKAISRNVMIDYIVKLRKNNNIAVELKDNIGIDDNYNLDMDIKSDSFENLATNMSLYKNLKVLTSDEKKVLFSLYVDKKSIGQIASETGGIEIGYQS